MNLKAEYQKLKEEVGMLTTISLLKRIAREMQDFYKRLPFSTPNELKTFISQEIDRIEDIIKQQTEFEEYQYAKKIKPIKRK